jgi:hypothetical protein
MSGNRINTSSSYSWMSPMDQSYYTCMGALDLPITLGPPQPNYQASLSLKNAVTVLWRDPYGGDATVVSSSGVFGSLPVQIDNPNDFAAFFRVTSMIGGPILVVDGVDYSSQYETCLARSGYAALITKYFQEQADLYASAGLESPQAVQNQVNANNKWAACARSHGWLIADSTVPPTGVTTQPEVKISADIAPDQLRKLLNLCPIFDVDLAQRINEWINAGSLGDFPFPEALPLNPIIAFDLSPFDAVYLPVLLSDEGRPLFDRLMTLYKILYGPQTTSVDTVN